MFIIKFLFKQCKKLGCYNKQLTLKLYLFSVAQLKFLQINFKLPRYISNAFRGAKVIDKNAPLKI